MEIIAHSLEGKILFIVSDNLFLLIETPVESVTKINFLFLSLPRFYVSNSVCRRMYIYKNIQNEAEKNYLLFL